MVRQGYEPGDCMVEMPDGSFKPACKGTLRREGDVWCRLIRAAHLSRPEDYFSIYQSGCNHGCLKCHSWDFSRKYSGFWASTDELAEMAAEYEGVVTVWEPRERATMFHATDLCHHCGMCIVYGVRGRLCPRKLRREQVILSPQGYGPARNIVSFTGGDVVCQAGFYAEAAEKIKRECSNMWVLIETNGYGLTPENLDVLASGGVDSFWLDIKAYDEDVYRRLCGTTNKWILKAPELIVDMGFVLEVLTLYIPGWVEREQIVRVAELLHDVDPEIPFTILAFFPAYKLTNVRSPNLMEMVSTYLAVKDAGLRNVKLGNCHVFAKSQRDWDTLIAIVGQETIS
ncbi:MAG: radical SAM protein [Candidatus Freyarchaeota archaeon]|nr:radical SAM protein [Candidatus Jordarchaeia archaeon]